MRNITFSYNETKIKTKADGAKIEQFKTITFNIDDLQDQKNLEEFFRTYVYSVNKWIGPGVRNQAVQKPYDGWCASKNYSGLFGIALDYDNGSLTLADAQAAFKPYVNIIHTSTSHLVDVPRHRGIQERFRVILPFLTTEIDPYQFENQVDIELLYSLLKERYTDSDDSVFQMARKFYPFTGQDDRYEFHLNIPDVVEHPKPFYTITFEELEQHKMILDGKSANKKKRSTDKINRNDIIIMKDRKTKKRISDITRGESGVMCYCLFCDDLESEGASAQINLDDHGNFNLYCHHENRTFWEDDLTFNSDVSPNLYFDEDAGFPALYNTSSGIMKFFKNRPDWISYTKKMELPADINTTLPRCTRKLDLRKKFGIYVNKIGEDCFNSFQPTKLLEDYEVVQKRIVEGKQKELNISGLKKNIPYIWKVIENLFGTERDHEDLKLFLNWLAFCLQSRRQSNCGWIIITKPGAGKGVLAELIVQAIVGKNALLMEQGNAIGAQFSAEDVNCWFKVYNEIFTKADWTANLKRREWLKHRIGTKDILIEAKGFDKRKYFNNVNYLLFSNLETAFVLETTDRRFFVSNTLHSSKEISSLDWFPEENKEFEDLIAAEVPIFAKFLQNVKYNSKMANRPVDTPPRKRLIEFSKEDIDYLITKLNLGDATYFELDHIYVKNPLDIASSAETIKTEVLDAIENLHAIPSRYAHEVLGYHMKQASKVNLKRKLEQHDMIINHQIWDPLSKTSKKYYIHKSQIGRKSSKGPVEIESSDKKKNIFA